jgi:hypothetical protein
MNRSNTHISPAKRGVTFERISQIAMENLRSNLKEIAKKHTTESRKTLDAVSTKQTCLDAE